MAHPVLTQVKGHKSGCRKWVHAELEKERPGMLDQYRERIRHEGGTESAAYIEFAALFYQYLDRCLCRRTSPFFAHLTVTACSHVQPQDSHEHGHVAAEAQANDAHAPERHAALPARLSRVAR